MVELPLESVAPLGALTALAVALDALPGATVLLLPLFEDSVDVELVPALLRVLVPEAPTKELMEELREELAEELAEMLPAPEERFSLKTPPPTVLGVIVFAFLAAIR